MVKVLPEHTSSDFVIKTEEYLGGPLIKDKLFVESTIKTWTLIPNKYLMFFATLLGDWVLTVVLSLVGVGFAYLYASLSFLSAERMFDQKFMLLTVIGPIFTVWNIAQYASFAVQTTGHIWPRNHLWAIKEIGLPLLLNNLFGWSLIILAYFTYNPEVPAVIIHVGILATVILAGIWIKTSNKVAYVIKKFHDVVVSNREDAVHAKRYAMLSDVGENGLKCPFSQNSSRVVAKQAMGPTLCFLWTAVYSIGLGLLYKAVDGQHVAWMWVIYALTLTVHNIGARWLTQLIKNARGVMMYSKKMMILFCFIYTMVSCTQVRLVITRFEGTHRIMASIIFAVACFALRQLTSRKLNGAYKELYDEHSEVQSFELVDVPSNDVSTIVEKFEPEEKEVQDLEAGDSDNKADNDVDNEAEQKVRRISTTKSLSASSRLSPFLDLSRTVDKMMLDVVCTLITANTTTIILSSLSCAFSASPNRVFIQLGECKAGLLTTVLSDVAPLLVTDVLEIVILVLWYGIPGLHFFWQFDWFMVVAAVLVVYLNVIVVIWAVSPMFSTYTVGDMSQEYASATMSISQ
jgi:hypothetical protein